MYLLASAFGLGTILGPALAPYLVLGHLWRGGPEIDRPFDAIFTVRDGMIVRDEMQKDAERFFGMLDVNHDGEIDPDEIAEFLDRDAAEQRERLRAARDSPR